VNQALAVGYVAARLVECGFIAVGILSVPAVVTLRQDVGGAGAAAAGSLSVAGRSLVAIHDWSFLLGPGFVVGIGNGLILGYLMYAPALVPRRMALLGVIGGPLLCASGIAVLFGVFDAGSSRRRSRRFRSSSGSCSLASTSPQGASGRLRFSLTLEC
jgi:hypothetical protein